MTELLTDPQHLRTLPRSLARVVADLETRQIRLLSRQDLAQILGTSVEAERVDDVIKRLVARGWIRRLPLRAAYEFLPAAGGPWESGDPWLELRAAIANTPLLAPQIALGSAAFLRGLSDRHPSTDLIAVNVDVSLPPGLRSTYKVIRTTPSRLFGATAVDSLSVATPARLVLEVAMWWQHAGDLRNPDHWIKAALDGADIEELSAGALRLGGVITARSGYLAHRFGNPRAADALVGLGRPRPVFLGPRPHSAADTPFDSTWGVYDALTAPKSG